LVERAEEKESTTTPKTFPLFVRAPPPLDCCDNIFA
jgi:hypothetical protein